MQPIYTDILCGYLGVCPRFRFTLGYAFPI